MPRLDPSGESTRGMGRALGSTTKGMTRQQRRLFIGDIPVESFFIYRTRVVLIKKRCRGAGNAGVRRSMGEREDPLLFQMENQLLLVGVLLEILRPLL